ncbi:MAG: DUF1573 domain-containing protein [Bacteroidetes bacterium]|nr:DUF1573 domain-containing protein [Bacteroidota bacterium]
MKSIYIILLCLGSCTMAIAQQSISGPDSVRANGPIFHFNEPDLYDFGDIKEGAVMVHDFVFTNAGKRPLIIDSAMASCGCTMPTWGKEPILPGKTGKITVTYYSAGHAGAFIKNIFISSNAITPGESYVLHIKGNVLPRKTDKN